jgi:hypothetical protein
VVGENGKFSFFHTLANDQLTEGTETLDIKLFSDANRTSQVGSTATVTINDTSKYLVTLRTSATSINEGSTLTTTVSTTNVASNTTLYYSLSGTGITTADFTAGALTGSGVIGSDGKFSFSHTLANDQLTEGNETLNIKLFSDAARTAKVGSTAIVTINDTSKTPPPTSIIGSTGVDILRGNNTDQFFSPLGVPATGGVDQIIIGGGRNQILLANDNGNGNLYANAKEADYLLIDGFNPSNDQLLVASGKSYGTAPLTLGSTSGIAVFEDRNADAIYSSGNDDLLALLKGVTAYSSSSLVMAG